MWMREDNFGGVFGPCERAKEKGSDEPQHILRDYVGRDVTKLGELLLDLIAGSGHIQTRMVVGGSV